MELLNVAPPPAASLHTAESAEPLCACHGFGRDAVQAAIAAGADSVKAVFQACGGMPKCGDCVWTIRDLLEADCKHRQ